MSDKETIDELKRQVRALTRKVNELVTAANEHHHQGSRPQIDTETSAIRINISHMEES